MAREYVQSPSRAHKIFSGESEHLLVNAPFLAFQYYVRIYFAHDAIKELVTDTNAEPNIMGLLDKNVEQLSPIIKNITMPKISIDTDVMNEYNRKRLSQTKLNFEPIKMTLHDTADGLGLGLWQLYYLYYFQDGSPIGDWEDEQFWHKDAGVKDRDINPQGYSAPQGNFGYNVFRTIRRNLITKMEFYQIQGTSVQQTIIHNPRITDFSQDTLTYEESRPLETNFTIEYEYAEYRFRQDLKKLKEKSVEKFLKFGMPFDFVVPGYKKPDPGFLGGLADSLFGEGTSDLIKGAFETGESVVATAKEVLGKVQAVSSTYSSIKSKLPFGLGKKLPKNPLPDVRKFSAKVSTVQKGFTDVKRVTTEIDVTAKDVSSALPPIGPKPPGKTG